MAGHAGEVGGGGEVQQGPRWLGEHGDQFLRSHSRMHGGGEPPAEPSCGCGWVWAGAVGAGRSWLEEPTSQLYGTGPPFLWLGSAGPTGGPACPWQPGAGVCGVLLLGTEHLRLGSFSQAPPYAPAQSSPRSVGSWVKRCHLSSSLARLPHQGCMSAACPFLGLGEGRLCRQGEWQLGRLGQARGPFPASLQTLQSLS